jgi:hypothetical protein
LESLTSPDLVALAEEYGIDVPANLNRRLIIGELLDAGATAPPMPKLSLPKTYNETAITAILRLPVWVYVYWDFSKQDLRRIEGPGKPKLLLRTESRTEFFVTPLAIHDRDYYVHLSPGRKPLRFSLVLGEEVLACSPWVELPHGCPRFSSLVASEPLPPLLELSGYRELLHTHYRNHRHSLAQTG